MSNGLLLCLWVFAALCSAFFSAAETALTSISDATVYRLREQGRRGAERLEHLRAELPRTLGTLLVCNTLINAAAGTLGAALAISLLGERLGVIVATGATTALLLVLGEVTPKTYAARRPEQLASAIAAPVALFVKAFTPATWLLSRIADILLTPLGAGQGRSHDVTEQDVKSLISLSHEQGTLEKEETQILHNVLDFGETAVRDVMVTRARMVSLPANSTFDGVEAICREHRYSRYPVWRETPDDIVGILHVKDLFDVSDADEKAFDLSRYLRPAVFIPELKRAENLFREMRRRRFHMAIVVDETGSVAGLVTLEDCIERILGAIDDEHDEPARRPVSDGTSLIVEGGYSLGSLERELSVSLDEPEAETVAGFLLRKFGRIPRTGARTRHGDLEFLVERATPRAIERIRITRTPGARRAS
jgi:putative hemolysin